jgi:membrane protease YdiL (CAAX protease family)
MTNQLIEPMSKRLFFALISITVGVEIILFLSGYSTLAGTVYDSLMVASLFIGLKISNRLSAGISKTKRQLVLQFTGSFLLFFLGSTVINTFSAYAFQDFSNEYDQYVQDYTEMVTYEDEPIPESEPTEPLWTIIDEIDTVGYDLFVSTLAGLEEVWRLAYIILILLLCKKVFPNRWEKSSRDIFLLTALFATSILFGIDHTLSSQDTWPYRVGAIVTFANMGLLFGLIMLWTRSLWVTVFVHSVYDIAASLSWYYHELTVEIFALIVLIVHLILLAFEKKNKVTIIESEEIAK